MPPLAARVVVIACCSALVACSTLRTVPGAASDVRPGDDVRVTLTDGATLDLRVVALDRDALVGQAPGAREPTRVAIDQVARLEKREFDGVGTTLLGVSLLYLAAIATLSRVAFFP